MGIKTIKVVEPLGHCDDTGLSFHQADYLAKTKTSYEAASDLAKQQGLAVTGPARVLIVIEQDVITDEV